MDSTAIFNQVVAVPMRSGWFEHVNNMHEPKVAPQVRGLTCAVWIDDLSAAPRASGLAASSALLVLMVRVYSSMVQEPIDAIDPNVFRATDDLWRLWHTDLQLDDEVMSIDVLGIAGTRMRARAGYVEHSKHVYRCMTTTLPILVADAWPQTL